MYTQYICILNASNTPTSFIRNWDGIRIFQVYSSHFSRPKKFSNAVRSIARWFIFSSPHWLNMIQFIFAVMLFFSQMTFLCMLLRPKHSSLIPYFSLIGYHVNNVRIIFKILDPDCPQLYFNLFFIDDLESFYWMNSFRWLCCRSPCYSFSFSAFWGEVGYIERAMAEWKPNNCYFCRTFLILFIPMKAEEVPEVNRAK